MAIMATSMLLSLGFDIYNHISKCCGYTSLCSLNDQFNALREKLERDRININTRWISGWFNFNRWVPGDVIGWFQTIALNVLHCSK